MRGPSVVIHTASGVAGQLACPYCGLIVGQFDPKARIPEGSSIIEPKHDAPCGLRCVGSAEKYWEIVGEGVAMHSGPSTCPVCEPKPCPMCAASRTILCSLWDAVHTQGFQIPKSGKSGLSGIHAALDRLTEAQQRAMQVKIPCPRCKATGMVDGLSL